MMLPETAATVWDTLNVLAASIVFAILSIKLFTKVNTFTPAEAIGMGLIAAGCIMQIAPMVHKPSPFDDWAGFLMRFGMATYFIGRHFRHRYANWAASRQAEEMLKARGMLPRKDK